MVYTGIVHKYGDNINTDVIIPTRYCTTIEPAQLARYCLAGLDTEFVKKVKSGDVLVAGHNFGCGSSREVAPIAIKAAGISCVIARSFARIFYRNAVNMGLLIIESPELVDDCASGDHLEIDTAGRSITNLTRGSRYSFPEGDAVIEAIVAAGGLVPYIKTRFENRHSE